MATPNQILHSYHTGPEYHAAVDTAVFKALQEAEAGSELFPAAQALALYGNCYVSLRPSPRGPVPMVFIHQDVFTESNGIRVTIPGGHIHIYRHDVAYLSLLTHLGGNPPDEIAIGEMVGRLQSLQRWMEEQALR